MGLGCKPLPVSCAYVTMVTHGPRLQALACIMCIWYSTHSTMLSEHVCIVTCTLFVQQTWPVLVTK